MGFSRYDILDEVKDTVIKCVDVLDFEVAGNKEEAKKAFGSFSNAIIGCLEGVSTLGFECDAEQIEVLVIGTILHNLKARVVGEEAKELLENIFRCFEEDHKRLQEEGAFDDVGFDGETC